MTRRLPPILGKVSAADASIEARIGKRITPRPDGCWIFDGDADHYGSVNSDIRGAAEMAHRWVYRTLIGPIPHGHHLHHRCFNKGCVNPHHLEPLSATEHMRLHRRLEREARSSI